MENNIKNIIKELEDKIEWHNKLALMYGKENDKEAEQIHFAAAMSFEFALQIVRKNSNKEEVLKLVK